MRLEPEADEEQRMILQVRADAGQVRTHVDAVRLQIAPGADAGALQKRRGEDGACTDDDFACIDAAQLVPAKRFDADCTAALEEHAPDMSMGKNLQIRTRAHACIEIAERTGRA